MDRVVRLYQLWGWLPHFRAIAETEHLPTASSALGLSPSALSRALKQLEAAVGRDLFTRDGRTIRLNESGSELLAAVRLAMRGIDDALVRLRDEDIAMSVRVSAPGPFHMVFTLAVADRLRSTHPQLGFELSSCARDEIVPWLCRGLIDVAVHEGPIAHPELSGRHLADIDRVVCCAPGHPLSTEESVGLTELTGHSFVAPPRTETGIREDGWPPAIDRSVALTVSHMQMGLDACKTGRYLTLLPRPVARANGLAVLTVTDLALPPVSMHATTRQVLATQAATFSEVLDGLVAVFVADL